MRDDEEASEALIEAKTLHVNCRRYSKLELFTPWLLALVFFCSTLFLALRDSLAVREPQLESFEQGFSTDFVASSPGIPVRIIKKRFTNDLLYNDTAQSFYNQRLSNDETAYIGEASSAINEAWRALLHAQYMALDSEETKQLPSSDVSPIWWNGEHNFMELSVFHNLHCLNELRLALAPDSHQYARDAWMSAGKVHLDHCIDQIRQALMCHSDLTPVPMKAVNNDGAGRVYVGNGEEHTCRDFDAIWTWVEERGKKNKALND